jgi:hypothetical protein
VHDGTAILGTLRIAPGGHALVIDARAIAAATGVDHELLVGKRRVALGKRLHGNRRLGGGKQALEQRGEACEQLCDPMEYIAPTSRNLGGLLERCARWGLQTCGLVAKDLLSLEWEMIK